MISALIGVLAPFIPDFLNVGRSYLDDAHERKMMKLRMEHQEAAHDYRMEELELESVTKDRLSARKHADKPGFGIQMLEAARGAEGVVSKWAFNIAFGLYTVVDLFSAFVRPSVTYFLVGLYAAIKASTIYLLYQAEGSLMTALQYDRVWSSFDNEMLVLILGYWFGSRIRHKANSVVSK